MSGPAVLATIDELEKKYAVSLAPLVMKVMVKDISLGELVVYFAEEAQMEAVNAEKLSQELKERIFKNVLSFLENKAVPVLATNKPSAPASPIINNQNIKTQPALPKQAEAKQDDRSAFYFSPEDEEEVRELAKKLETYNPVSRDQNNLDKKIREIEGEFNISFSSEDLLQRFRQIIKTYLLGIRKRIETKLALIKPFESGGLNLDALKADKILETADKEMSIPEMELKKPNRVTVPEDFADQTAPITNALINRDAPYDLAALAEKGPKKAEDSPVSPLDNLKIIINQDEMDELNKNTAKPEPTKPTIPDLTRLNTVNIPITEKKEKVIPTGSYLSLTNPRQSIPVDMSPKTRMDDVRFVPKVMGPIDELRYFDLINYRRLSTDPAKAAAKIQEKIGFLEEEHFNKKIEAIKAWRQSPLNRLYLEVGRQSIDENRPMEVIIEERKNKKQDYLTGQEIEAIMDLNKALRF